MRHYREVGDDSISLQERRITMLESWFDESGPPKRSVQVYRMGLSETETKVSSRQVVKLTERRYAIPLAENLKLGSLEYYRRLEESSAGIGDSMEGRVTEGINELAERLQIDSLRNVSPMTGEAVWQVDGFWLYCTSLAPRSGADLDQLKMTFEADYAASIDYPSAFAEELGDVVAVNVDWANLKRSGLERIIHSNLQAIGQERLVKVYHGDVTYTDTPAELIMNLPEAERAQAACFVKRTKYAWQREYRFAVSVRATPAPDPFYPPVTPKIRALVQPDGPPDGTIASGGDRA